MSEVAKNLEALLGKLEDFASSKTVVGDAIHIGDVILLPLVDVTVGVGAGGGENKGGGGGLGAKITPSAVIAIVNGNIQLVNIKNQDAVSKLIDMAPGIAAKLNFGSFGNKDSEVDEEFVKKTTETVVKEEKIVED